MIDELREFVGSLASWTIRWRYLTIGLVGMIFLMSISLVLGGFVRGEVFPALEGDTIVARVLMPPGTPLERTEQVVADLEKSLAETNEAFRSRQPNGDGSHSNHIYSIQPKHGCFGDRSTCGNDSS